MSIDKFGHYSGDLAVSSNVQRGPPGEGFKLTDDGNFNISNKRLCNVGDPELDDDAVNVKYMRTNSITLTNTDDCYDVKMKKVINLADPNEPCDAVNKNYLENATKSYLADRIPIKVDNNPVYSFKNNRVAHIAPPVYKFDAANKLYVDNKLPDENTQTNCCDFKQKRLINVADPINLLDAINKQTLLTGINNTKDECKRYIDDKIYYLRSEEENSIDFNESRLTNVADPKDDTDVINQKTLTRVMNAFKLDLEDYKVDSTLVRILYKLYKGCTKDNPVKTINEFRIVYIIQSLYETS